MIARWIAWSGAPRSDTSVSAALISSRIVCDPICSYIAVIRPSLTSFTRVTWKSLSAVMAAFQSSPRLDVAWHMLAARDAAQPLHVLLNGVRTRIEVGADFGVQDSMDDLIARVGAATDAGYQRVKLKIRPGA